MNKSFARNDVGQTPEAVEMSIHAGGGTRYNFMAAMGLDGFLPCTFGFKGHEHSYVCVLSLDPGSCTSLVFCTWFVFVLLRELQRRGRPATIVMDNAPWHPKAVLTCLEHLL